MKRAWLNDGVTTVTSGASVTRLLDRDGPQLERQPAAVAAEGHARRSEGWRRAQIDLDDGGIGACLGERPRGLELAGGRQRPAARVNAVDAGAQCSRRLSLAQRQPRPADDQTARTRGPPHEVVRSRPHPPVPVGALRVTQIAIDAAIDAPLQDA